MRIEISGEPSDRRETTADTYTYREREIISAGSWRSPIPVWTHSTKKGASRRRTRSSVRRSCAVLRRGRSSVVAAATRADISARTQATYTPSWSPSRYPLLQRIAQRCGSSLGFLLRILPQLRQPPMDAAVMAPEMRRYRMMWGVQVAVSFPAPETLLGI